MGGTLKRWLAVSAAVTGQKNEKKGILCQDMVTESLLLQGVICVLADGAGSARYADIGASIAVNTTLSLFAQKTSSWFQSEKIETIKEEIINAICDRLKEECHKKNCPNISEFASTLLWIVVEGETVLIGQLGDGAVIGLSPSNDVLYFRTEQGEYANQTVFTTSKYAKNNFYITREAASSFRTFALMSDGSAQSLIIKKNQLVAKAIPIMASWLDQYPRTEVQQAIYKQLLDIIRMKCFDDCALGLVHHASLPVVATLEASDPRVMEFVNVTKGPANIKGTQTRLKLIQAFIEYNQPLEMKELANKVNRSESLLRKYLHILQPRLKVEDI